MNRGGKRIGAGRKRVRATTVIRVESKFVPLFQALEQVIPACHTWKREAFVARVMLEIDRHLQQAPATPAESEHPAQVP